MSDWIRLDRDFLDNAKVIAAGQDGAMLFIEILAVNDRGSRDGILSRAESTIAFLARRLRASFGWTPERSDAAMKMAIDAELVVRLGDGRIKIDGWDAEWRPPMTEAERAAKWRSKKRGSDAPEESSRSQRDDDRDARNDGPVTPVTPTSVRPSFLPSDRTSSSEVGGGRKQEQPPEQPLSDAQQAMLDALTKAGVFPAARPRRIDLACRLVVNAFSPQDVDDLRTLADGKGLDEPAGWMTKVLDDPAALKVQLNDFRKPAPLYGEQRLCGPGDKSRMVDPASVGMAYCDQCHSNEIGRHLVDHGPIGWRPGMPQPSDPSASLPKDHGQPTSDGLRALEKKIRKLGREQAEESEDERMQRKLSEMKAAFSERKGDGKRAGEGAA